MTDKSKQERDQRALDALFVSQLRRHESSDEVEHLPRLTPEERAGLDSLGPDFIDRLVAGGISFSEDDPPVEDEDLLCAGGMDYGMNRAEEVNEETEEKLDERRKEIIKRLKKDAEDAKSDS